MDTVQEIVKSLKHKFFADGEVLYNLVEFCGCLETKPEKHLGLGAEGIAIVPFYLASGKRMELYEYSLTAALLAPYGFEQHVLKVTKKTRIRDIPEDLLYLHRACYLEYKKNKKGECYIAKKGLQDYFAFLLNDPALALLAEKACGAFCKEHLWVEIF